MAANTIYVSIAAITVACEKGEEALEMFLGDFM